MREHMLYDRRMDSINLWGMLGCAVAYAGAVFAGVDGLGDNLLQRDKAITAKERSALRMKTGSKVAASLITVITAGIVLILDSNWVAFVALTLAFAGIMAWVFVAYREGDRVS